MKKTILALLLIVLLPILVACGEAEIVWSDDTPFRIETNDETIKILQITDLHLAYGISHLDMKTYDLIDNLAKSDDYDLIAVTGDMVMSPQGASLLSQFVDHMEALEIPWTLVWGNHDTDHHTYARLIETLNDTTYLLYKNGPELEEGGYGNFVIDFVYQDDIIYHAYFLDSKGDADYYNSENGEYDALSEAQVSWYEDHVKDDTVHSSVFMHIPLRQYMNPPLDYEGIFLEDRVYAQGADTGFFDMMKTYGLSEAVFVGHDHLNDFSFTLDGILLAYGRVTGYTAYGYLERGGRHIEISNGLLETHIILGSDVG